LHSLLASLDSSRRKLVPSLTAPFARHHRIGPLFGAGTSAQRYLAPLGRVLFALIFILSAPHLISGAAVGTAHQHGVPFPSLAVPLAGIIAGIGGLSVALGYHGRIGAWLLVLFLVPVTLTMHAFWAEGTPAAAQTQQIEFLKNLALVGAALFVAYCGSGPVSFDERLRIR
jgi:putative oxidoreductase